MKSNRVVGFSLLELLVAVALLGLLLVVIFQVVGMFNISWQDGRARVDNFTKARALMDLMTSDLQDGVFRIDLAEPETHLVVEGAETTLALLTRRAGNAGSLTEPIRPVALVVYRLNITSATLSRGDAPLSWSNSAISLAHGSNPGFNPTLLQNVNYFQTSVK